MASRPAVSDPYVRELGTTARQKNKAIRQEKLREQLANKQHESYVSKTIDKLEDIQRDLSSNEIRRLQVAADLRMRLIDKYLPSLKSIEVEGNQHTDLAGLLQEAGRVARILADQEKDITPIEGECE